MSRRKSGSHEDEKSTQNSFEQSVASMLLSNQDPLTYRGSNGLHMACIHEQYYILKYLLDTLTHQGQLNKRNVESGWTPLHSSIYQGNLECSVLLTKAGADMSICDRDGLTPLDLVAVDHPGLKYKARSITLARVEQAFQTDLSDELSLSIGDIMELFHSKTTVTCLENGWVKGQRLGFIHKGRFPRTFVSEINDKEVRERGLDFHEIFLWGNNANYTLGQKDSKNRTRPELVADLSHNKVDVRQVCLGKFHCLMLSCDGVVFSCGHGRGGRLGHGHEQTLLVPKQIPMPEDVLITAIAAGRDHSLFLDQMGRIYSCGVNSFNQLGHLPAPEILLKPTQIYHASYKSSTFVGVAAARFHSAVFTKSDVFTFGLNGGQLGHPQGSDFQIAPRLVSSLHGRESSILEVAVSDGATVCLFSDMDIFVLQNFLCRKITPRATRFGEIRNLVVHGGTVKTTEEIKLTHHLEHGKSHELRVCFIDSVNEVVTWRQAFSAVKKCVSYKKKYQSGIKANQIALAQDLLVVTDTGELLKCSFASSSLPAILNETVRHGKTKPSPIPIVSSGSQSLQDIVEQYQSSREEVEEIYVEHVPLVYRAVAAATDPSCRTFGVIQSTSHSGLLLYPVISDGTLNDDLQRLYDETDVSDDVHDLQLVCKDGLVPAHQVIISAVLPDSSFVVTCGHIARTECKEFTTNEIRRWVEAVYQGEIRCQPSEFCSNSIKESHVGKRRSGSDDVVAANENLAMTDKKREVKDFPLLTDWKKRSDIADITVIANDGRSFSCHRCILSTRCEYFRGMLMYQWLETQNGNSSLTVDVPGNILRCVLDFLYTDSESYSLPSDASLEILCDLIICCDQFLIQRLREICESNIASFVTLRNAIDLYRFAMAYNAELLTRFTAEFIALNLCHFLESRQLEQIEVEELRYLSATYKHMVSRMEARSKYLRFNLDDYSDDVKLPLLTRNTKSTSPIRKSSAGRKKSATDKKKGEHLQDEASENKCTEESTIIDVEANVNENRNSFEVMPMTPAGDNVAVTCQELNDNDTKDLQNIMNEEKVKETMPIRNAQKWGVGKRKKSQRELKLERKMKSDQKHSQVEEQNEVADAKPLPWGQNSAPSPSSFAALMDEERKQMETNLLIQEPKTPSPRQRRRTISSERTLRLMNPATYDRDSITNSLSSQLSSPWGEKLKQPSPSVTLEKIMARQDLERVNAEREQKKALHLIQIEERAMDELLRKYLEHDKLNHDFVVERLKPTVSQPIWQHQMHQQ